MEPCFDDLKYVDAVAEALRAELLEQGVDADLKNVAPLFHLTYLLHSHLKDRPEGEERCLTEDGDLLSYVIGHAAVAIESQNLRTKLLDLACNRDTCLNDPIIVHAPEEDRGIFIGGGDVSSDEDEDDSEEEFSIPRHSVLFTPIEEYVEHTRSVRSVPTVRVRRVDVFHRTLHPRIGKRIHLRHTRILRNYIIHWK